MASYKSATDPAKRLKKLRENGHRMEKVTAMIVHRISPEIKEAFGGKYLLLTEGAGIYGHKFYHAFSAITPTIPKYNFWWREVARRCDSGGVNFL